MLIDFVAPHVEQLASATSFVRTAGGSPANVAVAAARLGASSAFVGAVGQDPFGEYLDEILTAHDVDVQALKKLPAPMRTTLAFVAKNLGGIPDFLFYHGADSALSVDDVPRDLIEQSAFLYLSSMMQIHEGTRAANLHAADVARAAGTLVCFDPNLRPGNWSSSDAAIEAMRPLLTFADIVKVNEEEARTFASTDDVDRALDALDGDNRLAAVTLGENGCRWRWKGEVGSTSAPKVEVADTTGAGDAFVGAMLAELARHGIDGDRFRGMQGETVREVMTFACAAASLSCIVPGAMISLPTRERVQDLLRS